MELPVTLLSLSILGRRATLEYNAPGRTGQSRGLPQEVPLLRILLILFAMVAGLFALIALTIRTLIRKATSAFSSSRPSQSAPPRSQARFAGVEMVRDPQCGAFIQAADSLTEPGPDGTLHFCSEKCRNAWKQERRGA